MHEWMNSDRITHGEHTFEGNSLPAMQAELHLPCCAGTKGVGEKCWTYKAANSNAIKSNKKAIKSNHTPSKAITSHQKQSKELSREGVPRCLKSPRTCQKELAKSTAIKVVPGTVKIEGFAIQMGTPFCVSQGLSLGLWRGSFLGPWGEWSMPSRVTFSKG